GHIPSRRFPRFGSRCVQEKCPARRDIRCNSQRFLRPDATGVLFLDTTWGWISRGGCRKDAAAGRRHRASARLNRIMEGFALLLGLAIIVCVLVLPIAAFVRSGNLRHEVERLEGSVRELWTQIARLRAELDATQRAAAA